MGVLVVQHVRAEGPHAIGEALVAAGLRLRVCRVWAGDPLPESLAGVEALVVMGGPMAAHSDAGFPTRHAELDLLREALAAEVPVLGVGLGARLLAVAAGGAARTGSGPQVGWAEVRTGPAADRDPLFAGAPERLRVPHRHGDTMELPHGAALLASCERCPVQAFRVGASAWGLQFHLEMDEAAADAFVTVFAQEAATAPGNSDAAPGEGAEQGPYRDRVFGRFAALVAARAAHTATRTFFTPRADAWEARFAADGPRYVAAVARMGLLPGQTALDLGCGSGRALPALRAGVGDKGKVFGVDVTSAMLTAAAREGRAGPACLLVADCHRLPLPPGTTDGIFSAGLLDHLPAPPVALREWARVTAPGGTLLLFHPSGRAERAARHGRPLSPDDPLGEPNLRPMLDGNGWQLVCYEDKSEYFLARAVRVADEARN
ncbi:methyltransferase domain-containing protein [Streptomyces sp. NBC_00056]|uniref:methyltransferase domain-containing protein n=1 Tax=unclassified Streptomyces TaxID=2593676 RepID=UPI002E7FDCA7|nr:methyltransferase domain-containing protein [Streptomyces sp. NBC_00569]WUB93368.1 methyltransferase domain-containing protein [Streptomyces sp. NBC_00569]